MSKQLIKTMMTELREIIPNEELEGLSQKIEDAISIKTRAGRSNIDAVTRSERIKLAIDKLKGIKEEIVEKIYEHGIEDPEKIKALMARTILKLNKAMESKHVIVDEIKKEQAAIDHGTNDNVQTTEALEDKNKLGSEVNENGEVAVLNPSIPSISRDTMRALVNKRFKLAMADKGDEIDRLYQKYRSENGISDEEHERLGDYVIPFKKSIIKAYKIYKNIDDYLEIPDNVETPTFEELYDAVEQMRGREQVKRLMKLSRLIEDARTQKIHEKGEKVVVEQKISDVKNEIHNEPVMTAPSEPVMSASRAPPTRRRYGKLII